MIPNTVTLGQLGQKKQHQNFKGKGAELLPPVIVEEGEEVSLGSFDMKQYTVNPNQTPTGKSIKKPEKQKRKIIRDDLSRSSGV